MSFIQHCVANRAQAAGEVGRAASAAGGELVARLAVLPCCTPKRGSEALEPSVRVVPFAGSPGEQEEGGSFSLLLCVGRGERSGAERAEMPQVRGLRCPSSMLRREVMQRCSAESGDRFW